MAATENEVRVRRVHSKVISFKKKNRIEVNGERENKVQFMNSTLRNTQKDNSSTYDLYMALFKSYMTLKSLTYDSRTRATAADQLWLQ